MAIGRLIEKLVVRMTQTVRVAITGITNLDTLIAGSRVALARRSWLRCWRWTEYTGCSVQAMA